MTEFAKSLDLFVGKVSSTYQNHFFTDNPVALFLLVICFRLFVCASRYSLRKQKSIGYKILESRYSIKYLDIMYCGVSDLAST